jgi:hypothetical protein
VVLDRSSTSHAEQASAANASASAKGSAEANEASKKKKIHTSSTRHIEPVLYLAQAQDGGQVSGVPQYGQVAPNAKKKVEGEAVKRENQDRGVSNGDGGSQTGTTPGQITRARHATDARDRGNRSRLANQRELEPHSMDILSASYHSWAVSGAMEVIKRRLDYAEVRGATKALRHPESFDAAIAKATQARVKLGPSESFKASVYEERINTFEDLKTLHHLRHPETLNAEIAKETQRLQKLTEHTTEYNRVASRIEGYKQVQELHQKIQTFNEKIANAQEKLKTAKQGTPEYEALERFIETSDKLRIGKPKTGEQREIADAEIARLKEAHVYGQEFKELVKTDTRLLSMTSRASSDFAYLRDKATGVWKNEGKEILLTGTGKGSRVQADMDAVGLDGSAEAARAIRSVEMVRGLKGLSKGVIGGGLAYGIDSWASSYFKSPFLAPSSLEIMAVSGTSMAPVPKFVPGAGGNLLQRLGSRVLWEGGVMLGSKLLKSGYDYFTDPEVEKRHLDGAKQALNDDRQKRTPESMGAAIDAIKALSNHDNQIQQMVDDTIAQIGTTDRAKQDAIKRDLVALHGAFALSALDNGTRVGGRDMHGNVINGPTQTHYIFAGKNYDFGGIALTNIITARNLMNELGIPITDPVAKRIYSSTTGSAMSKVLDPHKDELPEMFNQLKTMAKNNDPDAQWLSGWLKARVVDQNRVLEDEEKLSLGALQKNQKWVPQLNEYAMAKVYQDQALLETAYAAAGQDPATHLQAAHDALKAIFVSPKTGKPRNLSWDGRKTNVGGQIGSRESDLPEIIKMYQSLGGTVDW